MIWCRFARGSAQLLTQDGGRGGTPEFQSGFSISGNLESQIKMNILQVYEQLARLETEQW